jgi:hypothetical protein
VKAEVGPVAIRHVARNRCMSDAGRVRWLASNARGGYLQYPLFALSLTAIKSRPGIALHSTHLRLWRSP